MYVHVLYIFNTYTHGEKCLFQGFTIYSYISEYEIFNSLEKDKLDLIYSAKKHLEKMYLFLPPFLLSVGRSLKVVCQSSTIIRRQLLIRTPVYFSTPVF